MPSLYAEIDINAPQSVVWEALLRKDQWRYWNTFLYDCDPGLRITRGGEIFLAMQRLEGDEETEFQPLITMVRPPYMMRWISTIPGLRSEHIFELRENVPGRTHYIHRELFSGILSKVFLPFIRQDERQGLRRMAQQLKMYVENSVLGDRYLDQDSRNWPYYDDRRYGNPPYNAPPNRGGYEQGYPRNEPGYPDYGRRNDYPPDYPRDYPPDYPRDYPPDYPPRYDPRRR
ncbi:hypothetical protein S7335_2924 [Synechococcus sp. PCC 7335]|uniref:SRPBCC domain-containing protein n=1 Tax=Synechococcus sp. (strain ATCC 29403 / PCC 7335) TaxID=91464 RepID=UPI00017EDC7A|nr:SRPBCC domain-containing protein [Synechococcus sp. PCC 7335]EDX85225.1 hypothetical protein S7335_2924 [Synechococcus sp. PCC 7335]